MIKSSFVNFFRDILVVFTSVLSSFASIFFLIGEMLMIIFLNLSKEIELIGGFAGLYRSSGWTLVDATVLDPYDRYLCIADERPFGTVKR